MIESLCRNLAVAFISFGTLLVTVALAAGESSVESRPSQSSSKKEDRLTLPPLLDGKIVFDIEERFRAEFRDNNRDFDSSAVDNTDDSWLLNRFRLGLTIKPAPWLKLYAQTQDAREAFSDRPNVPGVRGAEGDNIFDLRQAYVLLGNPKQFPVLLTLGRQAFNYGDNRLVADSKWGNFGRTFDAVRLRVEQPHFWIESFFMRPVQITRHSFDESDAADNFAGVYFSTDVTPKQTTDLYLFFRDKRDNQPDLDPTNVLDPQGSWNGPAGRYTTIGARAKSKPDALDGWDYTAELAVQRGYVFQTTRDSRKFDLSAWAAHVSTGYTASGLPWKPRLGLEYDFGSGDRDPNDNNSESFQNLFPSNHENRICKICMVRLMVLRSPATRAQERRCVSSRSKTLAAPHPSQNATATPPNPSRESRSPPSCARCRGSCRSRRRCGPRGRACRR